MNKTACCVILSLMLGGVWLTACSSTQPTPATISSTASSFVTVVPLPTETLRPTRAATHKPAFSDPAVNSPTPRKPTRTPTPSLQPSPTLTSTPVSSLQAHRWKPEAVLVLADRRGGDGCCIEPHSPDFVLYADGRLFISRPTKFGDYWHFQIFTRQLERVEICQFLNTVDQTGFFDYDPSTYSKSDVFPIDGASTSYIQVNAWRSKSIALYGLHWFMQEDTSWYVPCPNCPPLPTMLPALRNMHRLLYEYHSDTLEIYQPARLGLWISPPFETIRNKGIPWPLQSPTLAELSPSSANIQEPGQSSILRGEVATLIYKIFDESIDQRRFTDGKYSYDIYARPLLPYEVLPSSGEGYSSIPSPIFPTPSFELSCNPSDGVLEIP